MGVQDAYQRIFQGHDYARDLCGNCTMVLHGGLMCRGQCRRLEMAQELEAAATKRELNIRSQSNEEIGEKARAALKTLEEDTGSPARQMRSDMGSTRVVNGTTSVDYPASGAAAWHGQAHGTNTLLRYAHRLPDVHYGRPLLH